MKECEVCCMPMSVPADFGGGDTTNNRCRHCCYTDGSHKSYDEILKEMTDFMLSEECEVNGMTKAKSRDEALARANAFMQNMPVWAKEKKNIH